MKFIHGTRFLSTLLLFSFAAFGQGPSLDLTVAPEPNLSGAVRVLWYAGSDDVPAQYRLLVTDTEGGLVDERFHPGTITTDIVHGLDPSRTYHFRVEALDLFGGALGQSPTEVLDLAAAPQDPLSPPFAGEGLDAILDSCSSQNFPLIYVTMRVEDHGVPRLDLTAEQFACYENAQLQTDLFDVVLPSTSGGVRQADFVFLIDTSGSMGGEIADVRRNLRDFAESLGQSDIDFRLGLVKFGNQSGPNPFVFNNGALTEDVGLFESFVDTLTAYGGFEPGFLAVRMAIAGFQFRPGSQIVFILVTDEDSDDRNKLDTLNLLIANDVTLHAAVDCGFGTSNADYCRACDPEVEPLGNCSLRGATGGLQFGVSDPFDAIFDTIVGRTGSAYIPRYRSDNPNFDATERTVECVVTDAGRSDSVRCTYIPGAAPRIVRTQETVALEASRHVEGATLRIAVDVYDDVAPFVSNVTLFHRTTNAAAPRDYARLVMTHQGGNRYVADVQVGPPGLDYYVSATDTQVTSFDPSTDPSTRPYQIAVLPNEAPVIEHTPVQEASAGDAVEIRALVTDTTNGLAGNPILFWRRTAQILYREAELQPVGGNSFVGSIPAEDVTTDGVEYYIEATDDLGVSSTAGTRDVPLRIAVTEGFLRLERVVFRPLAYRESGPLFEECVEEGAAARNLLPDQALDLFVPVLPFGSSFESAKLRVRISGFGEIAEVLPLGVPAEINPVSASLEGSIGNERGMCPNMSAPLVPRLGAVAHDAPTVDGYYEIELDPTRMRRFVDGSTDYGGLRVDVRGIVSLATVELAPHPPEVVFTGVRIPKRVVYLVPGFLGSTLVKADGFLAGSYVWPNAGNRDNQQEMCLDPDGTDAPGTTAWSGSCQGRELCTDDLLWLYDNPIPDVYGGYGWTNAYYGLDWFLKLHGYLDPGRNLGRICYEEADGTSPYGTIDGSSLHLRHNFPYDWRKQLANAGTDLARLVEQRPSGFKALFIAHSTGGIVVRSAIERSTQPTPAPDSVSPVPWDPENAVERIVYLGVPHGGLPKAYLYMQLGYNADNPDDRLDLAAWKGVMRTVSRTWLAFAQLLPQYGMVRSVDRTELGAFRENDDSGVSIFQGDTRTASPENTGGLGRTFWERADRWRQALLEQAQRATYRNRSFQINSQNRRPFPYTFRTKGRVVPVPPFGDPVERCVKGGFLGQEWLLFCGNVPDTCWDPNDLCEFRQESPRVEADGQCGDGTVPYRGFTLDGTEGGVDVPAPVSRHYFLLITDDRNEPVDHQPMVNHRDTHEKLSRLIADSDPPTSDTYNGICTPDPASLAPATLPLFARIDGSANLLATDVSGLRTGRDGQGFDWTEIPNALAGRSDRAQELLLPPGSGYTIRGFATSGGSVDLVVDASDGNGLSDRVAFRGVALETGDVLSLAVSPSGTSGVLEVDRGGDGTVDELIEQYVDGIAPRIEFAGYGEPLAGMFFRVADPEGGLDGCQVEAADAVEIVCGLSPGDPSGFIRIEFGEDLDARRFRIAVRDLSGNVTMLDSSDWAPVAVASDTVGECVGGAATLRLNASESYDRTGLPIHYRWSSPSCAFDDTASPAPGAECPLGDSIVTLVVDNGALASAPVTITARVRDTTPPVGAIESPEDGLCTAEDVTVVHDFTDACDPAAVTYTWTPEGGPTYVGHGDRDVVLVATDVGGNTAVDAVGFSIDRIAPVVRLTGEPSTLLVPSQIPFSTVFSASDDDGATGGIVGERAYWDDCLVFDGASFGDGDGLLSDETLTADLKTFCDAIERCSLAALDHPVVRVEAVDCAGNRGTASRVLPMGKVLTSRLCQVAVTMEKNVPSSEVRWEPVFAADSYDVVRGDVSHLRASGGIVELGPLACLTDNGPNRPVTDPVNPAPGEVFFYLVRYKRLNTVSEYGWSSADEVKRAGATDCER